MIPSSTCMYCLMCLLVLFYLDHLGGDYSSGGFGQDYQSSYGGGPMKSSGGYGASRSQPYGGDGTTKLPGVFFYIGMVSGFIANLRPRHSSPTAGVIFKMWLAHTLTRINRKNVSRVLLHGHMSSAPVS